MARTILVTGSSRGIGRAIALRLAQNGFDLVLHCRSRMADAQAVAATVGACGRSARILQFDVADRAAARAALEADIAAHGAYWGVVLNAGATRDKAFPAMSDDDWDSILRTNLDGFFNVIHPLVMPMVQAREGGRIVTLASISGLVGNRGQVNYSASKAGLIGATKALALELAKRRITVNCVAPGVIESDMSASLPPTFIKDHVPLQRAGRAEEVAATVAFLMQDDAAYITRQVIVVDGGVTG